MITQEFSHVTYYDFFNALYYSGTEQRVLVPNDPRWNTGVEGGWTFGVWVYINSLPPASMGFSVLSKVVSGSNYLRIALLCNSEGSRLRVLCTARAAGGSTRNVGNASIPLKTWTLILFKKNPATGQLECITNRIRENIYYSDVATSNYYNTAPLQFGGVNNTTVNSWPYYQDTSFFFPYATSAAQDEFLYNGGSGNEPNLLPDCQGLWTMDHTPGSAASGGMAVVRDYSSFGNHGTPDGYTAGNKDFVNHYTLI